MTRTERVIYRIILFFLLFTMVWDLAWFAYAATKHRWMHVAVALGSFIFICVSAHRLIHSVIEYEKEMER